MRLVLRSALLVLAVVLAALAACGSDGSQDFIGDVDPDTTATVDPASASLELKFTHSSVPPQYHRSYVLTVEEQSAHVVVDSYGSVLADETIEVPDAVWVPFVASLSDDLAAVPELDATTTDGCGGGTRTELRVDLGRRVVAIDAPRCGSDNKATVAAIEALMRPIYEVVDLDTLTAID